MYLNSIIQLYKNECQIDNFLISKLTDVPYHLKGNFKIKLLINPSEIMVICLGNKFTNAYI